MDIAALQKEYSDATLLLAETYDPIDPQTPDEWAALSRYLDVRDRVRAARASLADALAEQERK